MSFHIKIADHVLYEDDYILVIDKPCSLMVEPDRNGHPNLLQQVRKYIKTVTPTDREVYAQHIHRLDRPVSGIVLFAKRKEVLKNLSEQFAERKVKKYYQALTLAAPHERRGRLENWHTKENKRAVIHEKECVGSVKVLLDYEITDFSENRFLWNIELQTGKYHQIRAQLSFAGYPIIGDILYNAKSSYGHDSIALHAYKLIFYHPITGEEIVVQKDNSFNSNELLN